MEETMRAIAEHAAKLAALCEAAAELRRQGLTNTAPGDVGGIGVIAERLPEDEWRKLAAELKRIKQPPQ